MDAVMVEDLTVQTPTQQSCFPAGLAGGDSGTTANARQQRIRSSLALEAAGRRDEE